MKAAILVILCAFELLYFSAAVEKCTWVQGVTCPITGGSYPKCGIEYPRKVDDNKYVLDICVAESPNAFGGDFDVAYAFDGKIIDIAPGYIYNCGKGDG